MALPSTAPHVHLGQPLSDKLTRANYSGWRAQILPPIRGARLFGLLDGSDAAPPELLPLENPEKDQPSKTAPNPAYDSWISRDQLVLGYLLQSIGPEVLPHVQRIETAAGVWRAVEEMFASQCQTKVTNLRIQLANTKKLQMTTDAFLTKMQSIVDELSAAGEIISSKEHVSFILAGLGAPYNALVAALGVVPTPPSLSSLYAQLRAYDERQDMLGGGSETVFETSANAAQRQGHGRNNYSNNRTRRQQHWTRGCFPDAICLGIGRILVGSCAFLCRSLGARAAVPRLACKGIFCAGSALQPVCPARNTGGHRIPCSNRVPRLRQQQQLCAGIRCAAPACTISCAHSRLYACPQAQTIYGWHCPLGSVDYFC
ncbi:hypothetical protein QYE76_065451 [Lolium multiflorum]|uniref:Retrotransposon Copia-like N-terminal domain-containing protein n=1 Tax=Lolium multiflorum TaxID=4521 RepID=A0AAD8S8K5_LOLMU|nr:hypothetical protein QYE76_065451 [Lolium multiflorum]